MGGEENHEVGIHGSLRQGKGVDVEGGEGEVE